jgi:hypothetical protein
MEVDTWVRMHKERLVAKVFWHIHGIEYDETFTPIENMDSVQLALASNNEGVGISPNG